MTRRYEFYVPGARTILCSRGKNNIPRVSDKPPYYAEEQGKNTTGKRCNKIEAVNDPN